MKPVHSFILANITWNSHGWESPSHDKSGFKWVAKNVQTHIPGESWNFKKSKGKMQYGYFQKRGGKVRSFKDGGLVFFASRNLSEHKILIVGLYARAQFTPMRWNGSRPTNIQASANMCLRFPIAIELDRNSHLPKHKQFTRNFMYIQPEQARNILADLLRANKPQNKEDIAAYKKLHKIARSYFAQIRASKGKSQKQPAGIKHSYLRAYSKTELNNAAVPVFVKILKNNKKLVQSYREHERIREIMAQYFTDNGYKLQQDKHLDLCAHKGKRSIIVEVKSCRADNIDAQIRAGVAQLYYYSYIYEHKLGNSRLCLALSGKPSDDMIHYIRDHCGIDLAFVVSGRTVYLKT